MVLEVWAWSIYTPSLIFLELFTLGSVEISDTAIDGCIFPKERLRQQRLRSG